MNYPMTRRTFLQGMCLLATSHATDALSTPLETVRFSRKVFRTSETRALMGSFFSVSVYHPDRSLSEEAVGRAFLRAEALVEILNRHRSTSAVGYLNERGDFMGPPPELYEVLARAGRFFRLTGGRFDVTVKPLLDLYESGKQTGRLPEARELSQALARVGGERLAVTPGRITFREEGMGITLDGIAKGYIVDKVIEYLGEFSMAHAMVDAGGDIRVSGGKSDGSPWRVAIYDPVRRTPLPDPVHLYEGAVATSGSYVVTFDQEAVHHHILNPETGTSPGDWLSVSVLARTAAEADALSTALMLLDPGETELCLEANRHWGAMFLTAGERPRCSGNWPSTRV